MKKIIMLAILLTSCSPQKEDNNISSNNVQTNVLSNNKNEVHLIKNEVISNNQNEITYNINNTIESFDSLIEINKRLFEDGLKDISLANDILKHYDTEQVVEVLRDAYFQNLQFDINVYVHLATQLINSLEYDQIDNIIKIKTYLADVYKDNVFESSNYFNKAEMLFLENIEMCNENNITTYLIRSYDDLLSLYDRNKVDFDKISQLYNNWQSDNLTHYDEYQNIYFKIKYARAIQHSGIPELQNKALEIANSIININFADIHFEPYYNNPETLKILANNLLTHDKELKEHKYKMQIKSDKENTIVNNYLENKYGKNYIEVLKEDKELLKKEQTYLNQLIKESNHENN